VTLAQAIVAAGMTPPRQMTPGKWLRFPGMGKSRANRAGWCRIISPTLAIFGDWSTGLTETWRDESHRDDAHSAKLLAEARARQAALSAQDRAAQKAAAARAGEIIRKGMVGLHPYLIRKGFPALEGIITGGKLVVPMRDAGEYTRVLSAQLIDEDGTKKFLPGGRAKGAIYRIGVAPERARRVVLCEGYATGLSLDAALQRLPGPHTVVVCFSARNLELIAERFPRAVVAADNDLSSTGEQSAKRTGLKWTMPYEVGADFNDLHLNLGLHVVVERMRELLTGVVA
jgi:putative DNA primase/helicase